MQVLLYYKYVDIENPVTFRQEQYDLCLKLNLKGRILIAGEGINGTVCGEESEIEIYKNFMLELEQFNDMEFKVSDCEEQVFPKLRVVVRDEIVTLGIKGVSAKDCAQHITPDELNTLMHSGEEYYLFDARNGYESLVGKFKDAITPDISNFRFLPEKLNEYEYLKKKKIVTYCTGGVRCEKFSALLKKEGFEDVMQLLGGIVKYGEAYPDDGYEGRLYVFDKRITVRVNSSDKEVVISNCIHCKCKSTQFINCSNVECNVQIICCGECDVKFSGGCSEDCGKKSRYVNLGITMPGSQ